MSEQTYPMPFAHKLGFGIMRLPTQPSGKIDTAAAREMIDTYLKAGFNYFDTAYKYHNGEAEIFLRENLVARYPRKRFVLADKLPTWLIDSREKMALLLQEQLGNCGVTYFDMLLFHNLGRLRYERINSMGCFDLLSQFKKQGLARYIGFSFHDTPETLDKILSEHPEVDFVQLQINYLDWGNPGIQAASCYKVAERHGKPVVVMEPVKGGTLAALPAEAGMYFDQFGSNSYASYALRFAASLKNVGVVLSGMSNIAQVQDNIRHMRIFQPLNQQERNAIKEVKEVLRSARTIPCTACQYCVEENKCPAHIPIPDIFGVYNSYMQATQDDALRTSTVLYHRVTAEGGRGKDCVGCGMCEIHCPQHLAIRNHLRLVEETLTYPLAGE